MQLFTVSHDEIDKVRHDIYLPSMSLLFIFDKKLHTLTEKVLFCFGLSSIYTFFV